MSDYAPALWRPSPNFTPGRDGQAVKAIVDHITGGAGGPSLDWLTNPASKVSSHYLIMRYGTIYQLVKEEDTAWGCGLDFSRGYAAYRSDLAIPWIRDLWEQGPDFDPNLANLANLQAINIEHEASAGQGLTEAQYQATLGLHRHLLNRHNLPADGAHVIGHSKLDAINRANDPGAAYPWARLFADLAGQPAVDLHALREHVSALDALLREAQDRAKAIWSDYGLGSLP